MFNCRRTRGRYNTPARQYRCRTNCLNVYRPNGGNDTPRPARSCSLGGRRGNEIVAIFAPPLVIGTFVIDRDRSRAGVRKFFYRAYVASARIANNFRITADNARRGFVVFFSRFRYAKVDRRTARRFGGRGENWLPLLLYGKQRQIREKRGGGWGLISTINERKSRNRRTRRYARPLI